MAHFYGTVQGSREVASRLGTKKSGVRVKAQGWDIGGLVIDHQSQENGKDTIAFYLTGGGHNSFGSILVGRYQYDYEKQIWVELFLKEKQEL